MIPGSPDGEVDFPERCAPEDRGSSEDVSAPGGKPNGQYEKLAERVARRIERRIADLGWPVGTSLGSEAELLAEYGVSRAVLREAIRLVEHHNVAVMKKGPGGGLTVTEPDVATVAEAVAIYLDRQGVSTIQLFDARVGLELQALELATRNLQEEAIGQLRAALAVEGQYLDRLEHGLPADAGALHGIHHFLARLSGNPAITLFIESLIELTIGQAIDEFSGDRGAGVASDLNVIRELHHAHERIVEAVISGDATLARHRMLRHLEAMRTWLI
jgi:DNA-binding FadR family transcriptional regulator